MAVDNNAHGRENQIVIYSYINTLPSEHKTGTLSETFPFITVINMKKSGIRAL